MISFDSLPQARVVRKGGQLFAPPPAPKSQEPTVMGEAMHNALAVIFGLWPITAVVLLTVGFMIAMVSGSP